MYIDLDNRENSSTYVLFKRGNELYVVREDLYKTVLNNPYPAATAGYHADMIVDLEDGLVKKSRWGSYHVEPFNPDGQTQA